MQRAAILVCLLAVCFGETGWNVTSERIDAVTRPAGRGLREGVHQCRQKQRFAVRAPLQWSGAIAQSFCMRL